jgi:HK97 gp10 family phage protein
VKIKGKDKFLAQIAALPQALRDEVRAALETSAEEMVDLAKRFAPVDSGALKNSISYSFGAFQPENANVRGVETSGGNARAAKGEAGLAVTVHAGNATAWYASLVEFGTAAHTIKPKRPGGVLGFNGTAVEEVHHPGASARPFFFPAYRLSRQRAKSRLSRSIRNGARKAFNK